MLVSPPIAPPAAVAGSEAGPGKASAAGTNQIKPQASAEPARATKQDPLEAALSPKALAVLKERQKNKKATAAPTADVTGPPVPDAAPIAADKPKEAPKPADAVKVDDEPDAGIIDFSKPGKVVTEGEDGAPAALTEAELADLNVVKSKLTEAHKDNAAQRKLKREALEAKDKLEKANKDLAAELEQVRKEAQTSKAGSRYLDQFESAEQMDMAREDALAALKQLSEDPSIEFVRLPGNRKWDMINAQGESVAAHNTALALEIIEDHGAGVKRLAERAAAQEVVTEKLPLLSKALPDFEKSYNGILKSDWRTKAPEIALDAALGRLVRMGSHVLLPAGSQPKQAAPKAPPVEKPAASELPSTRPPARSAEAGTEDLSHLRAKAMKGDQKALQEWIKKSGKAKAA